MSGKKQVSRRQFLNYTLAGLTGFLMIGPTLPMIRMAVDPVLKASAEGDYANVGLAVSDITDVPQRIEWSIEQVDGWYESEVTRSAWVFKNDDGDIVAHSPICTHLGCNVTWEGNDDYPNEYFCPCHNGRFQKDGTNIPGTPPTAPLHQYDQKVEDDMLFLGNPKAREEA